MDPSQTPPIILPQSPNTLKGSYINRLCQWRQWRILLNFTLAPKKIIFRRSRFGLQRFIDTLMKKLTAVDTTKFILRVSWFVAVIPKAFGVVLLRLARLFH